MVPRALAQEAALLPTVRLRVTSGLHSPSFFLSPILAFFIVTERRRGVSGRKTTAVKLGDEKGVVLKAKLS